MSKTTPRLGRGLSAIIGPRTAGPFPARERPQPAARAAAREAGLRQIALDRIIPNPRQPRAKFDEGGLHELAQSIRSKGVIQPVLLRSIADGNYELIAGERRWRAAKLCGLEAIPALVRELSDAESLEIALIENLQREDLGVLERAAGYQHYLDEFGVTVEELAQRLGQSRATISNYLRVSRLAAEIQELLAAGELGMGQARAIAGIDDPQRQLAVARLAVRRNLSVRQVESLARADADARHVREPATAAQARHINEIERTLSKALGLSVKLLPGRKKNSGRVVIRYGNLEEFDRIAERLGGTASLE